MRMDKRNQEQFKDQLKLKEYDQICHDWRHRDTLLWQTLAVSITISGLAFTQIFNPEIKWPANIAISLILLGINFVLLLTITKNHFYQLGSSELLKKMGQDKIIREMFPYDPDKLKDNLRICTAAENSRNTQIRRKNNKSGYKGVFWNEGHKKWQAKITYNYKNIHFP
jgi:hypothetical protein